MKNKWILYLSLAVFVFSPAFAQNSIHWLDINEGLKKGKAEKKPVLIFVYAVWCGACNAMSSKTFTDKKLIDYLNKNYISVKMDVDRQQDSFELGGKKYKVGEFLAEKEIRGIPTFFFVDKKGSISEPLTSFLYPDTMINVLGYYKNDCIGKNVAFQNYSKNPKLCD